MDAHMHQHIRSWIHSVRSDGRLASSTSLRRHFFVRSDVIKKNTHSASMNV